MEDPNNDIERAEAIQEDLEKTMSPLPTFQTQDEKETFISEVESSGNVVVYDSQDEPIGFIITKDYHD